MRAIEPHSEADPAALLLQILAAFGNLAGRASHFRVESDVHTAGLYAVIVGESSKSRKGTSWGRIKAVFREADPAWLKECVTGGAVSGEGLVWEVRDPTYKTAPRKGDDDPLDELPEDLREVLDPGVSDKRRLWMAGEFASILKAAKRETNTLSAALRELWDTGDHRTAAKNNPARCSGAHTSVVAHVTDDELRRLLSETDIANGFANRFLFVLARRSKSLAEPTQPDPEILSSLAECIAQAARYAQGGHVLERDDDARKLWRHEYGRLSEGARGIFGAITNRGEAQVVRLSLVYALLDRAPKIRVEHLRAALAVWDYCYRSAAYIFGDSLGDQLADKLIKALREHPAGLTRTDVRGIVKGGVGEEQITNALGLLERHGLASSSTESTAGRAATRWIASADQKTMEQTEQSPDVGT